MKTSFYYQERKNQQGKLGTEVFEKAKGGGYSITPKGPIYADFIIEPENSIENLYKGIRADALEYFKRYNIAWWRVDEDRYFPNGHLLSSQIHCLNHLFGIRKNHDAVLALVQAAGDLAGIHFDEVLPSFTDTFEKEESYISFEFVFHNVELLGERGDTRGANCTSVDALVYAKAGADKWLVPIEWKYTEAYDHKPARNSFYRYKKVISNNSRLPEWDSTYKVDPFYELGRQTLLMERIIEKKPEGIQADNFLHLIVIPTGNSEMRTDADAFRESLKPECRPLFQVISPEELLVPVGQFEPEVIEYLKKRYWE